MKNKVHHYIIVLEACGNSILCSVVMLMLDATCYPFQQSPTDQHRHSRYEYIGNKCGRIRCCKIDFLLFFSCVWRVTWFSKVYGASKGFPIQGVAGYIVQKARQFFLFPNPSSQLRHIEWWNDRIPFLWWEWQSNAMTCSRTGNGGRIQEGLEIHGGKLSQRNGYELAPSTQHFPPKHTSYNFEMQVWSSHCASTNQFSSHKQELLRISCSDNALTIEILLFAM